MTKKEAKKRIEQLKKVINYHRYLYHVLNKQEISEAALDSLKHELYLLEQKYPEFITKDSPTQRVEGKALDKFEKVRHKTRMLSLEDVFSLEEFSEWEERIKKVYPKGKYEYFSELKIDGFAISLIYKNGILTTAATRGDGLIGEDVTNNVKTIESVPLKIEVFEEVLNVDDRDQRDLLHKAISFIEKSEFEVRGEIYMTKKVFEEINKERIKNGEEPYSNPRNTAAGSIRQLDPKLAASRKLEFLAYAIPTDFGQKTHKDEHDVLRLLGFKTDKYAKVCKDEKEVEDFWNYVLKIRNSLAYQIDGVVVTVNDNETFKKLGVVGKAPRGSIAFKFPAEEATTIVEDIVVQVGRTGAITPVAYLRPVSIGGATISRATLHNEDEIRRLGLKIGDTVIVQRSGDVIPKITKVLKGLRTGKEKNFVMPKKCPVCGTALVKKEGEAILRCPNKFCKAKNKEFLYHFASKQAFNIVGLGERILDQLYEKELISDVADIFSLKEGDLLPLEGFAEKSAKNLIEAIQKSKKIPLHRFIYSLGIMHVGEETSRMLAEYISKKHKIKRPIDLLNAFKKETKESLLELHDIGEVVAESIVQFFKDEYNIKLLKKLDDAGIIIESPRYSGKELRLKGKKFVLTGELESFTRDEAKDKIRELGGEVSSSVSKNTDFVVVGKNPGSKYDKAKKLGIKILNEKEFLKILGI